MSPTYSFRGKISPSNSASKNRPFSSNSSAVTPVLPPSSPQTGHGPAGSGGLKRTTSSEGIAGIVKNLTTMHDRSRNDNFYANSNNLLHSTPGKSTPNRNNGSTANPVGDSFFDTKSNALSGSLRSMYSLSNTNNLLLSANSHSLGHSLQANSLVRDNLLSGGSIQASQSSRKKSPSNRSNSPTRYPIRQEILSGKKSAAAFTISPSKKR
jgi:hypothetical protein